MMNIQPNKPPKSRFKVDTGDSGVTGGQALGNALEHYMFTMLNTIEMCQSTYTLRNGLNYACDIITESGVLVEVKSHRDAQGTFRTDQAFSKIRRLEQQMAQMRRYNKPILVIIGVYTAPVESVAMNLHTGDGYMEWRGQPQMLKAYEEQYQFYLYAEHEGQGRWFDADGLCPHKSPYIYDWLNNGAGGSLRERVVKYATGQEGQAQLPFKLPQEEISEMSHDDQVEARAAHEMFQATARYMCILSDRQCSADREELEDALARVKSAMISDMSQIKGALDSHNRSLIELSNANSTVKRSINDLELELSGLASIQADDAVNLSQVNERVSNLDEKIKQAQIQLERAQLQLEQSNQNAACLGANLNESIRLSNEHASRFNDATNALDVAIRYLYSQLGVDIEEAYSSEG